MNKHILAIFMAVTMIVGSAIPAQAVTSISSNDTSEASELVSLYAATAPGAGARARNGLSIGDQIPVYELRGTQLVSYSQVRYYPVYSGNTVYGVYTVVDDDASSPTYSFSKEFAEVLNEFIADGDDRFSVVYDSPATYIKSNTQTKLFLKSMGYRLDGREDIFQDRTSLINGIRLAANQLSGMMRNQLTMVPQTYATRYTLPLDVWNQSNDSATTNLCWAGTIWAIGSYLNSAVDTTPKQISIDTKVGNNGAYPQNMAGYYKTIYGLEATFNQDSGVLGASKIAEYIDSGNPIHGHWQGSNNYGHSMAILGYQDDGMQICVMDTNIGDWKWMKNPDQNYKYTYGANTATWKYSTTF